MQTGNFSGTRGLYIHTREQSSMGPCLPCSWCFKTLPLILALLQWLKKDIKKLAKAEILNFLKLQRYFYIIEAAEVVAHRILQLLLVLERPQKHHMSLVITHNGSLQQNLPVLGFIRQHEWEFLFTILWIIWCPGSKVHLFLGWKECQKPSLRKWYYSVQNTYFSYIIH